MLHKLIFDATDANTIADSHSVGAFLRASDGTLLTHTDVGGKKALDVRVAEGINVEVDLDFADDSVDVSGSIVELGATTLAALENITVSATDLDIRDLAFATDKVDVTGSEVSLDSATLAALENITVSATDLDIRDLAFATDKVDVSGSEVSLDSATLAALENITVSATDLDIRDLTQADEVTVFQGTSPWVVSGSVTVTDAALANTAIAAGKTTLAVVDTAQNAVASPLANRKYLWLYNNDNRTMYIGQSGVDADGFPIPPGSMINMRAGAAVDIEFVSSKLAHDIRYLQIS